MVIDRVEFECNIAEAVYNGMRKRYQNRGKWVKAERKVQAAYIAERIALKLPGLFRKFDVELGDHVSCGSCLQI